MPDFGSNVTRMQQFSDLLFVGLNDVFRSELKTHPETFGDWLAKKGAEEFTEEALVTTGFGPMPEKTVGGVFKVDKPLISPKKFYPMKTYGLAAVLEYELVRWEKYGVFTDVTKMMARSGVDRKNVVSYAILNNGFSTADSTYTTYSGEALFDDAHVLLRGGTGKNAPTTPVALSYLGIQEGITDFATLTNEDGLFILKYAKRLICHESKRWIADTITGSEYRPDNANMNKNTLKGRLSVHSSPYLTDPDAWFLTCDKDQLQLRFSLGDDLTMRKDFQFSTLNQEYSMYGAWRVEVLHWFGTWGSTGA